jgi:histidine decarboxylase
MEKLFTKLPKNVQENFAKTEIVPLAQDFYTQMQEKAAYMFGFPAYHCPLSPLTQYLLSMHYTSPFSNNCGDIEERGYYAMDTKDIEKQIVGLYAEKFGMGDGFWGYVTSGGSESNSCGITLAFTKNPNGILYYSQSAHYSVEKYAQLYKNVRIPTVRHDRMDVDALFAEIEKNYQQSGAAANIVLTHGTTKYGACDDIDAIVAFLREKKIPYYIHVDAALFGGIPNNQVDAPILNDLKTRGADSVCVSLHKYVGFPDVKSVFVATKKPLGKTIAYIGQHDTTVSGSRSIPAYALYNHIAEQLQENRTDLYAKNVRFFEKLLTERNVRFYRAPLSNIFVLDVPSNDTCRRFQLSCFDEPRQNKTLQKAHVIIFPSHSEEIMTKLADALQTDLQKA